MNIYDVAFNELLHISELLRKMPLQYSPSTYKINDALLRAKKVEELLGLYRRKDIYGKTILPYKEYLKICDEIIIKEKELEELK